MNEVHSTRRIDPAERRPREHAVVGRLAPSPTGGLHIGHARTFLIAWLAARGRRGRVILRIEDIDASRVRPGAADAIVRDLRWLGLDWDEGPGVGGPHAPYLQSKRFDLYDQYVRQFKIERRVYPCTCTHADIARAASAPHAGDDGPEYPGTCAARTVSDEHLLSDRPFAWRMRALADERPWRDLYRGLTTRPVGGDFVIAKSSGQPAYQLAVVADDAAMGVNQVVRGDDLLGSTPRQRLLWRLMGAREPEFGHVPLVHGIDGKRLAKRDGSIKLETLRDHGIDPNRLVGWLAQSCGWSDRLEPGPPALWVDRFRFGTIPPTPWVADIAEIEPSAKHNFSESRGAEM